MRDADSGVVVSGWHCRATPEAIEKTTDALGVFAGRHGCRPSAKTTMTAAVGEALAELREAQSAPHGTRTGIAIDAATDGRWLTVRLCGEGRRPTEETAARLSALADRVELSADDRDERLTMLFEFSTGAGRDASPMLRRPGSGSPRSRCAAGSARLDVGLGVVGPARLLDRLEDEDVSADPRLG